MSSETKVSSEAKQKDKKVIPASPVETPEVQLTPTVSADERRFCSSCSRTKPVIGGVMARCANGTKRWKCADCHARSKAHLASIKKSQ